MGTPGASTLCKSTQRAVVVLTRLLRSATHEPFIPRLRMPISLRSWSFYLPPLPGDIKIGIACFFFFLAWHTPFFYHFFVENHPPRSRSARSSTAAGVVAYIFYGSIVSSCCIDGVSGVTGCGIYRYKVFFTRYDRVFLLLFDFIF